MDNILKSVIINGNENPIRNAAFALEYEKSLDYILEGLISRGSVNVLFGAPGIGKTYSLLSLACCIAVGKQWCGLQTKQVNCMFIDEESGETRLSLRLKAVLKSISADKGTPLIYISLAGFKLDRYLSDDVKKLKELITSYEIGLVVFDAMSDLMDGDENDKKEVQPVMTNLRWIAEETGAAIALIHHTTKAESDYRGSSAIKGSCDTMTHICASNGGKLLIFEITKARDFEPNTWYAKPIWEKNEAGEDLFHLDPAKKGDVIPEKSNSPARTNANEEFIIEYLEAHGDSPLPEIRAAAGPERSDAVRKIAPKSKKIHRTNPDAGVGKPAIYALGPAPDKTNPPPNKTS